MIQVQTSQQLQQQQQQQQLTVAPVLAVRCLDVAYIAVALHGSTESNSTRFSAAAAYVCIS
jgi:hypothetical protein